MNNKSSLRQITLSSLKSKHQDLFTVSWAEWYKPTSSFVFHRDRWWLIILGVLAFYAIGLINKNYFHLIDLDIKSAQILIDNRAANTVTIISMTLAVIGFLLGNLALKDNFAYKLLFKHSKLFSIIYFTLSTIGTLIILSLLKDTIKSEFYYSRLAICATYLVLIVLFLIGFLFRSIIHFTNSKKIQELLHNELIAESKSLLKEKLFIKSSTLEFKTKMESWGIKQRTFSNTFGLFSELDAPSDSNEKVQLVIKDVYLQRLKKIMAKTNGQILFNPISLNELTDISPEGVLQKEGGFSNKEIKQIRKCFSIKKRSKVASDSQEVKNYFDSKIDDCVSNGNYKDLESLLESYRQVFELEMINSN